MLVSIVASLIATTATLALADEVVRSLKVSQDLAAEAILAIRVLGYSIPSQIISIQLIAYLSAFDSFKSLNLVKIPSGCSLVLAPLAAVGAEQPLVVSCGLFFAIRMLTTLGYVFLILKSNPVILIPIQPDRGTILGLLKFGGWLSVSSIVSPLLLHSDRLVIGAKISTAAVAAYVACIDTVTKLHIVPTSISTALFPKMASLEKIDKTAMSVMYSRALLWTEWLCFPPVAFVVLFGKEILQLWISPEFAAENHLVFRITAAGMYLNCIAQIPSAGLHAIGKPDLTAKSHLVQAIFYVPAISIAASLCGLAGVAAVWTLRVGLDGLVLLLLFGRRLADTSSIRYNPISRHALLFAVLLTTLFWVEREMPALVASPILLAVYMLATLSSLGHSNLWSR
jgi:O-antigen/teichoic acid export membrane protein